WRKNGLDIVGATAATLTISSVTAGDAATYTVLATSTFNGTTASTLSNAVVLNIGPTITAQPANLNKKVGDSATFSVTATPNGGGSLSYQWRKDGTAITGKTGSSLVINPVAADDVGMYTVLVTNTIGGVPPASTLSSAASLNVAPVITVQP